MFTFINSLSFPILCGLLIVVMSVCFIGAYKRHKQGDRATAILAIIIGISTILAILFRYSQETSAPYILKNIGSKLLDITFALMLISMYIYNLYRYRKGRISEIEKQKLRNFLIVIPIIFLFVLIMVLILGR